MNKFKWLAASVAAITPTGGPMTSLRASTAASVMASRRDHPVPPSPTGQLG